jgi:hypothetical protein
MKQTITINYEIGDRIYLKIYLLVSRKGGGWASVSAIFGLLGGLLTVPLALLLWAGAFIAPVEISPSLKVLSNILFFLTLPLLSLGACCLDLLESKLPTTLPEERRPVCFERWRHLRPHYPHHN